MKNRKDHHDFIAEIVSIASNGASKTRIMNSLRISLDYWGAKRYLELALEKGLIHLESNKYKTTSKGFEFRGVYREMEQLEDHLNLIFK